MSVDTYLYIDKKFKVWMCIASCVCRHKKHCLACQKSSEIGQGKSLEDAMKIADKYDSRNPMDVEYGTNLRLWCK
jgi:hypothetical protein